MSYCKIANYWMETYAIEEIEEQDDKDTMTFRQPVGHRTFEYPEALWMKAISCQSVYDES